MANRITVSFTELKELRDSKKLPVQQHETMNAIELMLRENGIEWFCPIFKEGEPDYDAAVFADYEASKDAMRLSEPIEPRSEDGRRIIQQSGYDPTLVASFTSWADGPGGPGTGGDSRVFMLPGEPNVVLRNQFRDWVLLFDNVTKWEGGEMTRAECDWVAYRLVLEVSGSIVENPTFTGNAFVQFGVAFPAPGIGTHDLDLTKAVIFPDPNHQGYWNWSWPDTGRGEVTPAPAGDGEFHVVAQDTKIEFVKTYLLGSGTRNFSSPNPSQNIIFPHWILEAETHKIVEGVTPLKVVTEMRMARKSLI